MKLHKHKLGTRTGIVVLSLLLVMVIAGEVKNVLVRNSSSSVDLISPLPVYPGVASEVFYYPPVYKEVVEVKVATPTATAKVTAYSCGGLETHAEIMMNCPSLYTGGPRTANGTAPVPYKTMACDGANMGRTFHIEGVGDVTCTDTGGAINGPGRFDLYLPTVEEARAWGVKKVKYALK